LERTNRSLFGNFGFFGSYRITEKNKTATMSAAEQQLEGCPLPASLVALTLSIRRCVALLARVVRRSGVTAETEEEVMRDPFTMGTDDSG
jgi:hypothetical protein